MERRKEDKIKKQGDESRKYIRALHEKEQWNIKYTNIWITGNKKDVEKNGRQNKEARWRMKAINKEKEEWEIKRKIKVKEGEEGKKMEGKERIGEEKEQINKAIKKKETPISREEVYSITERGKGRKEGRKK